MVNGHVPHDAVPDPRSLEPIEYTMHEGGRWYKFTPGEQPAGIRIHAIRFSNGWEFDAVNGWRESTRK